MQTNAGDLRRPHTFPLSGFRSGQASTPAAGGRVGIVSNRRPSCSRTSRFVLRRPRSS
jgi:hypothetical protein